MTGESKNDGLDVGNLFYGASGVAKTAVLWYKISAEFCLAEWKGKQ
jgi:hypothetical protein